MSGSVPSLYDYPLYYDILFGWSRAPEADLYEQVFRSRGLTPGSPVLEVACGTGLVGMELARRGWQVTGLDLNADMLRFLTEAVRRQNLAIDTLCADMVRFETAEPVAAAFCPLSSFRLLPDDEQALLHLGAMVRALRPGGVYVLDMRLSNAPEADSGPEEDEDWSMSRDGVTVRAFGERVAVEDPDLPGPLTLTLGQLRDYTCAELRDLVARAPGLALAGCHPESGYNDEDISVFAPEPSAALEEGRTMVVLRRFP